MALNNVPVGDAIAEFIITNRTNDGTLETEAHIKFIWEGIMNIIYSDIKANAEVLPGSFMDSLVHPITGEGTIT